MKCRLILMMSIRLLIIAPLCRHEFSENWHLIRSESSPLSPSSCFEHGDKKERKKKDSEFIMHSHFDSLSRLCCFGVEKCVVPSSSSYE